MRAAIPRISRGGLWARWGCGGLGVAESTRGQATPNGMAGRHCSFEQAQGSPNAGQAPGGTGASGQVASGQRAESAA